GRPSTASPPPASSGRAWTVRLFLAPAFLLSTFHRTASFVQPASSVLLTFSAPQTAFSAPQIVSSPVPAFVVVAAVVAVVVVAVVAVAVVAVAAVAAAVVAVAAAAAVVAVVAAVAAVA